MEQKPIRIFMAFDPEDENNVFQHLNDPSRLFEVLPVINKAREQLFGPNKSWEWRKKLSDFDGLEVILISIIFNDSNDVEINTKMIKKFSYKKYKAFKNRAKIAGKLNEINLKEISQ